MPGQISEERHGEAYTPARDGFVDLAVWWKRRRELKLVNVGDPWRIVGIGSERARVARGGPGG
jgi:hypothetical protein